MSISLILSKNKKLNIVYKNEDPYIHNLRFWIKSDVISHVFIQISNNWYFRGKQTNYKIVTLKKIAENIIFFLFIYKLGNPRNNWIFLHLKMTKLSDI